jgi:hypothetical protein
MNQLALDFSENKTREWERESKEDENWTPEALCIVWWSKPFNPDKEAWNALPDYEREHWLTQYLLAREENPMPTAGQQIARAKDTFKNNEQIAQAWARELKAAFLNRQPCPIIPTPMFRHVLQWAYEIAQLTPDNLPTETEQQQEK